MGLNSRGWLTSYRREKIGLVHNLIDRWKPDFGVICETNIVKDDRYRVLSGHDDYEVVFTPV